MLSRLSSALKPGGSARGLYSISRRSSGWANYGRGNYRRLPPRISAPVVVVGVAGTVLAYNLTSAANSPDYDSFRNNLSELLGYAPKTAACTGKVPMTKTAAEQVKERIKLKARASDILTFCGVEDKNSQDKIIEEMLKYLERKEKGSGGTTETERHLINDAIHGPIPLSPLLYQIINTREFHRLKDLRQLGAGHYVYPGANHTRFEHSIGVCYVAGQFARSLKTQLDIDRDEKLNDEPEENLIKKMYKFEREEVICAEIAGLCHDLGHGPLSHMFEKVMKESLKLKVEHEKLSVAIFQRILTNPKVLGEFVYEGLKDGHVKLIGNMISPPDHELNERDDRLFLYEIVANKLTGIDVDKWDYYERDCHYLGILQDFQWRRTMFLGRIVMTPESYEGEGKLRVGFRDKEMENLYGMFRTRANIHRKACQHKTIKAVEKMIMEAMDLVQDLQLVWVPSKTDTMTKEISDQEFTGKGEFRSIKEAVKCAIDPKNPQLDWYLAMSDSIVGSIISAHAGSEPEQEKLAKAKRLLKRVEERDLYTCSAKKKVPKFFPLVEFLKSDHPSYDLNKYCSEQMKKDEYDIRAVERLMDHTECREFEKMVHDRLLLEEQSVIKRDNIWVEVVKVKHPSEKSSNPVDEVLFFKKPKTPQDFPIILEKDTAPKKASMVVVPQAFLEYELRVYDKRCKAERNEKHQKALENAMEKAWKDYFDKVKYS